AAAASSACCWEEHPRVRGDDIVPARTGGRKSGTPPRARGRLARVDLRGPGPRNTPACAGTTFPDRRIGAVNTEHPRVRGDDALHVGRSGGVVGTPPRARGRRRAESARGRAHGNTPACAGTTAARHHARVR